MEREKIQITKVGTYTFEHNYELIFKDYRDDFLEGCNITCGDNCKIHCAGYFNIDCGNNCEIRCGGYSNIICGNNCKIDCGIEINITCGDNCKIICAAYCNIVCGNKCTINYYYYCYIKAGVGSKLKYYKILKTISEDEEFIWWYIDKNKNLINTFEYESWKEDNLDKWNEFYGFVHNELDSATLF